MVSTAFERLVRGLVDFARAEMAGRTNGTADIVPALREVADTYRARGLIIFITAANAHVAMPREALTVAVSALLDALVKLDRVDRPNQKGP